MTLYTKLHPKLTIVCDICRLHHSCILQRPEKIGFVYLMWQMTSTYNSPDGNQCVRTGQRKMAVLGMAADHGDNRLNSLIMWWFRGLKWFCSLWNILQMKKSDRFHIMILFLNQFKIRFWIEFLIGQSNLEVVITESKASRTCPFYILNLCYMA